MLRSEAPVDMAEDWPNAPSRHNDSITPRVSMPVKKSGTGPAWHATLGVSAIVVEPMTMPSAPSLMTCWSALAMADHVADPSEVELLKTLASWLRISPQRAAEIVNAN